MQIPVGATTTADTTRIIRMGRTELRTSLTELTSANIAKELGTMFPKHLANANEIDYLIKYFLGYQPYVLTREKLVREDVDNRIVINYAKSATRDIVGYLLGKPVRYVPRKLANNEPVTKLSDWLDYEDKTRGDSEIAEFASICGTAFRGVFPDITDDGTPPFDLIALDPRYTFCVYSSDPTQRDPLYAGTFYTVTLLETSEVEYHFTIYTKDKTFTFTTKGAAAMIGSFYSAGFEGIEVTEKPHIIGRVPIVEYANNAWRIGDWETALSILDAINVVGSDSVNDVVQFVNSILAVIGAELDDDGIEKLNKEKVLNIFNIPPGSHPDVKYVAQTLDAASITSLREYLESALRVVLGIPDRKTRGGSGGDTGDAVFMRDGWMDIDLVATNKEFFFIAAERRMIEVVLNICKQKSELSGIKAMDIEIKFTRSKTANIQSKSQAYSTLMSTKTITPNDALEICDMHSDPQEVSDRGEKYWDEKTENAFQQQQAAFEASAAAKGDVVPSTSKDTPNRTPAADSK